MTKAGKQFEVTIVKGPLAEKEKLQSSAWAFMASIVKKQLDEGKYNPVGKANSN
ncbi:hypothetical protein [Pseudalkalibacillus sp. SCS-8]|uniref:hypothetical protein n=1 Tax=Pseudalkalibacillus nanhaiensis TaxID=3115291 RepID=UPI0032DBEE6A